ncbi:branched-chain amino acid ABC transporter permease [Undibacterium sp. KW1]|uniref:branched-chain amino acid ABC transporter permease n=1 Tax=Undibacterium sp. KW1 TaxID=2058624 RepID=UPI001331D30C|nr:branched-chain amino acid ABC transporter permease [Undibacterium sp. KW1]BBB62909.1 branched-chain amino acid ABC transporter permease [Undibacterium sp. KW1]
MLKKVMLHKIAFFLPMFILALLGLVPLMAGMLDQPFYVSLFGRIVIYALAAMALNLSLGYAGLVSFGHALFFGVGAYCVAIPAFYGIDSGWIQLCICIATCAVLGCITGLISLRTSGIAFIMITLAFAQMGYFVFVSLKNFGGDDGMTISNPSKFFSMNLGDLTTLYYVAFFLLCVVFWFMWRLYSSLFGMVLRGTKQNTRRINASGFSAKKYQLVAYVISAIICGIAGFLLANLNAFASPSTLAWSVSGDLIVMVVLGGMGSVAGPLIGAFVFLGLEEILKAYFEHWMVVFGPVIVLIALLGKSGIIGWLNGIDQRLTRLRNHYETMKNTSNIPSEEKSV